MIRKIGIIYQDVISRGLLEGLRDRLKCAAELVDPPAAIGKNQFLTKRNANLAWETFRGRGVGLVVRFTDADADSWQRVLKIERERIPEPAASIWIVGVAAACPEDWLTADPEYLAKELRVRREVFENVGGRRGATKAAINEKARQAGRSASEIVAGLVRGAPDGVFRKWLANDAFAAFYKECRRMATEHDCDTPNELDSP